MESSILQRQFCEYLVTCQTTVLKWSKYAEKLEHFLVLIFDHYNVALLYDWVG